MKKAIFLRMLAICLVALGVSALITSLALQSSVEQDLQAEALSFLASSERVAGLSQEPEQRVQELSDLFCDYRFTQVDSSGKVLGDSVLDPTTLESHEQRPEIVQAFATGTGWDKRSSATMGARMLYVARRMGDGTVMRVQITLSQVRSLMGAQLVAVLGGVAAALAVSLALAGSFARRLLEPIDQVTSGLRDMRGGDYGRPLMAPGYDEFVPLVNTVNSLRYTIHKTMDTLSLEKEKLEYLMDTMRQGVAVVDEENRIVLCNNSARLLFGPTESLEGRSLLNLTHNLEICRAVERCAQDKTAALVDVDLAALERIYSASVTPVNTSWLSGGVMVVFTDVTDSRRAEELRRDFIANASHELKTPVTSIRGFAELLTSGLVTSESQTADYLERIRAESARMDQLLGDVLSLSVLESGKVRREPQELALSQVAQEVARALAGKAKDAQVELQVEGEATLTADRDEMLRLLTNLVENAVKYNRPGGRVTVRLASREGRAVIEVEDTGIGIPEGDLSRVFERFYRVDKGRSRVVGGTGLGLAIVKHLVWDYQGLLEIKSKLGEGTTVTVKL